MARKLSGDGQSRPRRKMRRVEQGIQISTAGFLDLALPLDAAWWHTPNGGGRSKHEAGILRAMGVKAGIPDIVIFARAVVGTLEHRTIMVAIELKKDLPEATRLMKAVRDPDTKDEQARVLQRLEALGFFIAVCWTPEGVEQAIRDAGVPLRATLLGLPVRRPGSSV